MDWHTLKEEVYYEDGSLRDIYVLDTSIEDWRKWSELINQKYKVRFYDGRTEQWMDQVDFGTVDAHWAGEVEATSSAVITVGTFEINCHFFVPDELENDIHPEEFQSLNHHNQLMEYLVAVSKHLNKKVLLTDENRRTSASIEVDKGQIKYKMEKKRQYKED
jgi:hypothetical protein